MIVNDLFGGSLYRFRTYGFTASAIYPIDKFNRLGFSAGYFNVARENMDRPGVPVENSTVFVPSLSYVRDNVLWGYTAPVTGTRYERDHVRFAFPGQRRGELREPHDGLPDLPPPRAQLLGGTAGGGWRELRVLGEPCLENARQQHAVAEPEREVVLSPGQVERRVAPRR